jgi:hypothetical protein
MRSAAYLDAFVLACPQPESGFSSFQNYIENLISWSELRQSEWVPIYISRNASESLAEANAYPPYPDLKRTIDALGIKHIQPKDVIDLINGFLLKSRIVEDELGIDELLFDNYGSLPEILFQERQKPFPYHFQLLSVLVAMHRHFITDITNQVLITGPDDGHVGTITVNAEITDLLKKHSDIIPDTCPQMLPIEVQFYICRCLHSMHSYLEPCNTWSNANCEFALKKAIEIFVYQNTPRSGPYQCPIDYSSFSIGNHFIDSCFQLGFFEDYTKIRMLLRACAETILDTNKSSTHWIRKDAGGNSLQLKRRNDCAWRRDIDHEYHLHYWSTNFGPELSIVVKHNDFSIPE